MDKRNDGELVFAAPSYIGELAERARRVTELESEVATLKAVCGKKDEAIKTLLVAIDRGCSPETCGNQIIYDLCDLDNDDCIVIGAVESAKSALSLSPSSVAEYAVNERVGRAVMEFVNRKDTAPSDFTEREKQCYQAAITDVWAVSLNARDEAKARGEQP